MENKFDTYNASQIVPQMTLLQKFNKLIKYLHDNVYVNVFSCYVGYLGSSTPYNISNLRLDDRQVMVGDIVVFTNNYCAFVGSVSGGQFYVTNAQSFKGDKGDKGDTGDTGAQGISVTLVQVNSQNHLILRLSNNTTIDAGVIYANREKIELTGTFEENLEMVIEITQLQYNKLVQKDINLLINETTSGYTLSFSKSVNENSENDNDIYYVSSFATNNFTAIVAKITDAEQQVIGYAVTVSGFPLATQSSLSQKQDNLTPSSVNDGTIDKVLGFDSSNNLVKGAVSGGTKLYKHEITVSGVGSGTKYIAICTFSENISPTQIPYRYGKSILSITNENGYPYICNSTPSTTHEFYFAKVVSGNIQIITQQYNVTGDSSSTDVITEL